MNIKNILEKIEVLTHSSIRITIDKTIYCDPYDIKEDYNDADLILITHDHYDHLSFADIKKVIKNDTVFVIPKSIEDKLDKLNLSKEQVISVDTNDKVTVKDVPIQTIPSYNIHKPFHTKKNNFVGYIISIDNTKIYIAGDTDANDDNKKVKCDIALIPIGGTFTMNAKKAAKFINQIKPMVAIPIHYGSIVGKKSDEDIFNNEVNKDIQVEIKIK